MFYAMAFLTLGSSGMPIDRSELVPAYSDFQRRFWAREVDLADNQAKTAYGRVHWEQLSQNTRQASFDEVLRIISDRNTIQEGTRILLPGAPQKESSRK
jgi:hypothetical protein